MLPSKIDSKLKFTRLVTTKGPIDGEFTIQKGTGDLAGEIFVAGTAVVKSKNDGVTIEQEIDIVYPYREVKGFILEIRSMKQETE